MEDIPSADIATHPFLTTAWKESTERGARFINADPEEVTNAYQAVNYSQFNHVQHDGLEGWRQYCFQ